MPARLLGGAEAADGAVLGGGRGHRRAARGAGGWRARRARSSRCSLIAVLTIVLAWLASQLSPAWANRYLAAGVRAVPAARRRRPRRAPAGSGSSALALVAVLWAIDGAPTEKSNVRDVTESIAPSLRPGDLVVATQPEQVSVLDYYLPDGPALRDADGRRAATSA